MSTNRPFARNIGTSINGTQQVGNLAIGFPTSGFTETGLDWYGGPDEELGYIIAKDNPAGQSAADGSTAYFGFWRSAAFTDLSFIELGNALLSTNHATGTELKLALNAAGYWTSYGESSVEDGEWFFYSDAGVLDVGPPVNNGNVVFTRGNLEFETFNPNKTGEDSSNSIFFSLFDSNGNDYTTQFTDLQDNGGSLTITQGGQTVTYTSEGALFVFNVSILPTGNFFFLNVIAATQTQIATTNFNLTDPITITFNDGTELANAIITSNNEYISVDEGQYLAYNN